VRILERLAIFEVSPVLIGAGINTRTLDVKSAAGLTLESHAESVITKIAGFLDRCEDLKSLRAKDGRDLSGIAREHLSRLVGRIDELKSKIAHLSDVDTANELYREFLANRRRLNRSPEEIKAEILAILDDFEARQRRGRSREQTWMNWTNY